MKKISINLNNPLGKRNYLKRKHRSKRKISKAQHSQSHPSLGINGFIGDNEYSNVKWRVVKK